MTAVTDEQKFPHVMSGPEHLELGLRLAAAARDAIHHPSDPDDLERAIAGYINRAKPSSVAAVAAVAQLAQVHIQAAEVLTFAALAASESEELGKPWWTLLDPDGTLRLPQEIEVAHRNAINEDRERDFARTITEMQAGLQEDPRLAAADETAPISFYPIPADTFPWNPAPLVSPAPFLGPDREELVDDDPRGA